MSDTPTPKGNEAAISLDAFEPAGDDAVVPFQVDALDARGRAVQLGPLLDAILSRHDYPEPVARLLAETITLTVLLGTSLKFEGKFIAQTQTDGPVDMLVADFTTPSAVRGYARFDEARVADAVARGEDTPEALLGKGVLALTIDQGRYTQRYQGIVALDGTSLEEVARQYFRQSEQIPTEVRLAVAKLVDRDEAGAARESWRAGGLIAQFLPDDPKRMRQPDLPGGDDPEGFVEHNGDGAWEEVRALMGTVEASELTDPDLPVERLLYRLFHERGVRAYPPGRVADECSCSREAIEAVLEGFSADELADSTEDGEIVVTCEFCSTRYRFDPDRFDPDHPSPRGEGEGGSGGTGRGSARPVKD